MHCVSHKCPNLLKTLAYRYLQKMESACISASALHLKTHLQNRHLHQHKTTPFEATGAAVCGFHNEVE